MPASGPATLSTPPGRQATSGGNGTGHAAHPVRPAPNPLVEPTSSAGPHDAMPQVSGEPMPSGGAGPAVAIAPPSAAPSTDAPAGPRDETANGGPGPGRSTCTAPQLKRFIKSRVYVPMHELRRRFAINGGDDDVTVIHVGNERIYVGLPDREGRLLGELLRGGDVGYELSLDPPTPIVVGLYPMRPIPRV